MARGVFTFSKEGRARLASVLRALLILQLIVSLCMVIFCYNSSVKVMLLLKRIHKVTVYLLYGLILFHAYAMKLHYTGGLRLVSLVLHSPYWPRLMPVSRAWLVTGVLLPINGVLVYWACRSTMKALLREISSSLRIGISQYLMEPSWKQLMDTMQVELSCCGADKPNDWHEIPWINMDFLNENSTIVMSLAGADGKVLPPVSPYSCCTPRVLAPCYHDPLQQSELRSELSLWPLPAACRHAAGCVEALRQPLARALLALHCLNLLVAILEVVIVSLCWLIVNSAKNAALTGDCDADGPVNVFSKNNLQNDDSVKEQPEQEMQRLITNKVECMNQNTHTTYAISVKRRRRRQRLSKRTSYPYLS